MQEQQRLRGGKASRSSRGATAAASLLSLALLVGGASAKDLPDGYRVLHANVILRHGERTRLVKTTGDGEFGVSDDVVVSIYVNRNSSDSFHGLLWMFLFFVYTLLSLCDFFEIQTTAFFCAFLFCCCCAA